MTGEVRVDPHVLVTSARACEAVRASVGRDLADVEPETVDAARGLSGWYTQRALEDLVWWWHDDLDKLGRYLDTFAQALQTVGRDYQASDHASVERFDIRGR